MMMLVTISTQRTKKSPHFQLYQSKDARSEEKMQQLLQICNRNEERTKSSTNFLLCHILHSEIDKKKITQKSTIFQQHVRTQPHTAQLNVNQQRIFALHTKCEAFGYDVVWCGVQSRACTLYSSAHVWHVKQWNKCAFQYISERFFSHVMK